jgi:iron complex outermembrane receptor protein
LFEEGKTRIRLMAFGEKKTYQAWNGIDRKHGKPILNSIISEPFMMPTEILRFYDNETDNYRQNHYQLLWEQKFNDRWNLETTFIIPKEKDIMKTIKEEIFKI